MDHKFTEKIREWLDKPVNERNLEEGATMLLQLNRNRILHQNIIRRGEKMMGKLEYELKKHLRIRQDGMTLNEVVAMEKKVVPVVEQLLSKPEAEHAGKRADHDDLPEEIQKLWDNNFERYAKIKALFEELKAMEKQQPCDRYEKLKLLNEAEKAYREALATYDGYVKEKTFPKDEDDKEDNFPNKTEEQPVDPAELATQIGNARKYISEGKGKLKKLIEEGNEAKAETLRAKIVERVKIILQAGAPISDDTLAELSELGINL
ncbi:MAG: hypothetical protein J6V23_00475 [Bacteroidaceae bacterium]|nr:hypothetical protein [Bacteroidaceae bacterium]